MKEKIKLGISILLFCVALLIFLFFISNQNNIVEKKSVPVSLNISDKAGFNLNKSSLTFGNLLPGTSSKREIIIENNHEFPLNVELQIQGNIEKYLEYKKSYTIEPKKKKEIPFVARIPEKEEQGNYSGEVIVVMRQA